MGHCLDETQHFLRGIMQLDPFNYFYVFKLIHDPWSWKRAPQLYETNPPTPNHDALTLSTVCALWHEFSVRGSSDKLTEAPQEQIIWSVFAIGAIQSIQMTVFHFLPYRSAFGCLFWNILDHFNWEVYHFHFFKFVFPSSIGDPTL